MTITLFVSFLHRLNSPSMSQLNLIANLNLPHRLTFSNKKLSSLPPSLPVFFFQM
ncbi:hypothetical protein COLO4_37611 [Corchorus olitorius]|uniref:Uncharacterized protein n=1 Tax=Corchorus olitorius TaxID=93759 RepID=A0A1R3G0I6_9ROSI|nr:hypothetical protein COLO4_37611 [Corchorus olitorius]